MGIRDLAVLNQKQKFEYPPPKDLFAETAANRLVTVSF